MCEDMDQVSFFSLMKAQLQDDAFYLIFGLYVQNWDTINSS